MSRKALLNVDLENDFISGTLAVPGGEQVVVSANQLITYAEQRKSEWSILFSRDWHKSDSRHFQKWPVHCVANTPGADFHPKVKVVKDAVVISKGIGDGDGYDAFGEDVVLGMVTSQQLRTLFQPFAADPIAHPEFRDLKTLLRHLGVDEIYVYGLATDYCVKASAISAAKLGFRTFLTVDACRAVNVNPGDGDKAVAEMKAAGVVITTSRAIMKQAA